MYVGCETQIPIPISGSTTYYSTPASDILLVIPVLACDMQFDTVTASQQMDQHFLPLCEICKLLKNVFWFVMSLPTSLASLETFSEDLLWNDWVVILFLCKIYKL